MSNLSKQEQKQAGILFQEYQAEYNKTHDTEVLWNKMVPLIKTALEAAIKKEIQRLESLTIGGNEKVQTFLENHNSRMLKTGTSLADLIRRPELSYETVEELDPERPQLPDDVKEQVEIQIKYDGYIRRQLMQVEKAQKMEEKKLPADIDYNEITGLRIEARQKLDKVKPASIGQASRIAGVTPADVSVLLIYLTQKKG